MAYRRLMGYPPYPNSGRAKKYGVPGIMGYQDLWVKGTSTVVSIGLHSQRHVHWRTGCTAMSVSILADTGEVPGDHVMQIEMQNEQGNLRKKACQSS